MKHIKDIYPMVKQVRQRIVETMQERGLTEIVIMPDREEWLKQNPDKYEEDYDQACWDECPYVVYFDKYGCGYEYMVKKVELIGKDALGFPCFRMECYANELGYDRFTDDDVYDMKGVYEVLEKRLGLDEEPDKVWVVTFINEPEYEIPNVSVNVFDNYDAARKCLDAEWQTLITEVIVGYDEDVSQKNDDDFLFVDNRENRVIGEIKEREIRND